MTISMIATCALIFIVTLVVVACCKLSHDIERRLATRYVGDLPPGCNDSDCDPDARDERDRKERLREEMLEDRADAERDERGI